MTTSSRCSTCREEAGAIFCTGCKEHFCMKDFKEHRKDLSAQLDVIMEGREELQANINKAIERPISSGPMITQIGKWEEEMILKVKQIAEQRRQLVTELLNAKHTQITIDFQAFSKELQHRKESETFFEPDLRRFQQLVGQFTYELNQLQQPLTIELETKDSNHVKWDRLISIRTEPSRSIYQEPSKSSEFIIKTKILMNH